MATEHAPKHGRHREALDQSCVVGARIPGVCPRNPAPQKLNAYCDPIKRPLVLALGEHRQLAITFSGIIIVFIVVVLAPLAGSEWHGHPPGEIIECVLKRLLGVVGHRNTWHRDGERNRRPRDVFPQHRRYFAVAKQH
jgi:hypothetical protein